MTDSLEQISISDSQLTSAGGATGILSGSAVLDYSTGTSQGTFYFNYGGSTDIFSDPSVYTENNGTEYVYDTAQGSMDNFNIYFNIPSYSSSAAIIDTGVTGPGVSGIGTSYSGQPAITAMPVCFCTGALIRVARGGARIDVPVEHLAVGDLAVTASGALREIRWLGHRTIDCRRHPRPDEVMPVRIAAHAFGAGKPARDLRVSPGHAICVDVAGEVLVPAGALVNGRTIVRAQVATVTYWHVELDSHDIILAENLPSESYLDVGNRGFFQNAEVVDLAAGPDAPAANHADFCRPYVARGPVLEAVKARLAQTKVTSVGRDRRQQRSRDQRAKRRRKAATPAARIGKARTSIYRWRALLHEGLRASIRQPLAT